MTIRTQMLSAVGIAALTLATGEALACDSCATEGAAVEPDFARDMADGDPVLDGAYYRVVGLNGECQNASAEQAAWIERFLNGGVGESGNQVPGVLQARDRVMASVDLAPGARSGFDVQFSLSPAVAADTAFVAGIEAAAQVWESVINDNITVVVSVDFTSNQGFIAAASSARASRTYPTVLNALRGDASSFESNYVNTLPDVLEFDYGGSVFNTNDTYSFGRLVISAPIANFRALGFGDLNGGGVESSLVFNTDFTFDPNPFDGIVGTDLQYVMIHEIGHALGFVSGVDGSNFPSILDIYRVGALGSSENPSSLPELATVERQMETGTEAQVDALGQFPPLGELRLSTGNGAGGDGRQASHWKDQSLLPQTQVIGVMDPTFQLGTFDPADPISDADRLAFSLIGWDILLPGESADPPGAFDLTLPGDGATGVSNPPTFAWTNSAGANSYTIVITPASGGAAVINTTVNGEDFIPNASALAPGVTYNWSVTANNVFGSTQANGGADSFTMADVPGEFNQLSPADGAVDVSETPTFDWEDASDVTDYTIRVFPEGTSTAIIQETVIPSSFTPASGILQPGVTYRWVVIASNAVGIRPATGGIDFFTTTAPAPDCPDSTGDGAVDTADLLEVLANFNSSVSGGTADADFDGSGIVDTADLLAVLAVFNTTCP